MEQGVEDYYRNPFNKVDSLLAVVCVCLCVTRFALLGDKNHSEYHVIGQDTLTSLGDEESQNLYYVLKAEHTDPSNSLDT